MTIKLDAARVKALVAEMNAAVTAIATSHGLKINIGGGTYGELEANLKVKVQVLDTAGHAEQAKRTFDAYAAMLGLRADDLGRTFIFKGSLFKVTGLNPNAPKFCVLARRADGKEYRFPASVIRATAAPHTPPMFGSRSWA